ncbi:HCP-like protein [Choiromyces venosus 120613-1]|uniref:HCP-like protein n=1 Tax=Choiromyces venosus 120613-1 TaxID=1336337 RepID=A0A3N4J0E5_9PEZI|nr:HCP-like protein [Choiromyces venosus 120613-1]
MAETLGTSGVGVSKSDTSDTDAGATEWVEDIRDTMEASDDLFSQYEQTDDLDFLKEAIALAEIAVTSINPFHPNRAILSAKLRKMWGSKFENTKDEVDLDMSWVRRQRTWPPMQRHAVASSLYGVSWRVRIVEIDPGGADLLRRYERLGNVADLNETIIEIEKALEAYHPGTPGRVDMLNIWSVMLAKRFGRLGDINDLEKAARISEEVVRKPTAGRQTHIDSLGNLGNILWQRFERIGNLEDLQKAIRHGEAVLAATPRDHPDRAAMYSNLGVMFSARFKRVGDLDDLQKAIKHTEAALAATPGNHPDRAGRYSNLGNRFSARFERIGDLDDLQKAIKHTEAALAATSGDHPNRAVICSNLGAMFSARFERIGDLDDLQKAIKHTEAALAATSGDHPNRAVICSNLGAMFSARFERIGDLDDLQKAIKHTEAALAATPRDHPNRAGIYGALGTCFESRYSRTRSAEDFNKCLHLYHEAWHCRISPPRDRIKAARRAGHLLCSAGRFHESSSILEDAIQMMPSVNLQLLKRDDQQHILSELSGLASTAASAALLAGREAYHSLKLLELGRRIIIGFAIDSRSEVSDLKADHRFEFDQYHRLRVEINSPVDTIIGTRFLLPPSEEALKNIAKAGPIVVFNSTPYRSNAIIVTTTAITSLELPDLDYKETGDWMRKLASFGGSGLKRRQDNLDMKGLLMWLWDVAVGPVLERFESSGAILSGGVDETNLKRIWWIGVGQLSTAPFHAAGDHSRRSTCNTLRRYRPKVLDIALARTMILAWGEGVVWV